MLWSPPGEAREAQAGDEVAGAAAAALELQVLGVTGPSDDPERRLTKREEA